VPAAAVASLGPGESYAEFFRQAEALGLDALWTEDRILRAFLHGYYGTRFDVDQHAIFGPPRDVAARLREHVEAGISRLMLGVPTLAPVVRETAAR
jgi:alkanesulfonate monooxygenase SsuD/methylene tetrahydromethanopterin reductase-like flavin-dependent oxidoreductase (luciferase family)